MSVIHLHRPTRINRVSMSAANLLCKEHPNNSSLHQLIWQVIAKTPNKVFNLSELEVATEILATKLAHKAILDKEITFT